MLRMPSPPTLQTELWATFDVAHNRRPENYFCGVVGALHPCERRQRFQPCWRAYSPFGAPSPSPSNPLAARRMAECANARRNVCALPKPPLPIRARRWSRAHFNASPLRRLPSRRGSCFLRSRSPRHPSRRVRRFPSVGRRGWSRSSREGTACGRMRVGGSVYRLRRCCPLRG